MRKFPKFGPKLQRIHPAMVPRIKPLWSTPEEDVRLWAELNDVKFHSAPCPYSSRSMRARIRDFLNRIESESPAIKERIKEIINGHIPASGGGLWDRRVFSLWRTSIRD